MSKSKIKPSVGRVVMFVPKPDSIESNNGVDKVPAVIVRTWEHTSYQNDEVNLKVFTDGNADTWKTSVPHSENKEPGTWHWPERV